VPTFDEMDTEPFVLVSAVEPDEEAIDAHTPSPSRPRLLGQSTFAALPHAGLTLQTR
jgi:hypothetical protein